jgi:hypothetical protein
MLLNADMNKPAIEGSGWSEAQWFQQWLELASRN